MQTKDRVLDVGRSENIDSILVERRFREDESACSLNYENAFSSVTRPLNIRVMSYQTFPVANWSNKRPAGNKKIRSVNWHVTMKCNYQCRFCFYKNMTGEFEDIGKTRHKLEVLKKRGIEKINFAGGEPLTYKNLNLMLKIAKDIGFTVSIVTNGALLNENNIREFSKYVDWIGISVDSADEEIEKGLGRGKGNHVSHVCNICNIVHKYGMKLKINTTITKKNYSEDMTSFISSLSPDRWKIFQMLYMEGQNDDALDLILTNDEFNIFRGINEKLILQNGSLPVFESAENMLNSYFIIGPDGNILLSKGYKRSTIPFESLEKMELVDIVDADKYLARGGDYDWN